MDYIILNLLIFLFPVITFAAGLLISTDPIKDVGIFDKLFPKKVAIPSKEKCLAIKVISSIWTVGGAISIIASAAVIVIFHNSTLYLHIAEISIFIFFLVFISGFTYARIFLKISAKKAHNTR